MFQINMEASAFSTQIFNFLSFTVAALCVIMKVPQIWKIIGSGDTKGISLGSVLLEQCGYSIMLSYSFAMGYPLGSYLEYPFLVLQDHVVLGLIFHTRDMLSPKLFLGFLLYIIVYLTIGYRLLPDFIMSFIISLCTPLGISSKSAQILELYRRKDPGRLSIATWSIAAYGCYVRILTSVFQTKDIFMVTNFLSGAVLNTTIIAMIIYYGKQKKSKLY